MSKINIGITCIGYNCKEGLQKALAPWISIKNNPSLAKGIGKLLIGFTHGCFEETFKIGYPIHSIDGTEEYVTELKESGQIDFLSIKNEPQKEYEMWTCSYDAFKDEIDLLWMVNSDEMWELSEINKVIEYINLNNLVGFYKVNFKNFCIDEKTWVDDFIVPRIWWTKKAQGGLKRFYQDDLVEYNNGQKDTTTSHVVIPSYTVFPKHYSWVGSEEYLKRKIAFQNIRYGQCSYRWNEDFGELELNTEYYNGFGIPKPVLQYDF